jgi:LuxR family transcriptional regulator, quorum-sensing system regulator SinR
VPTVLGLENVDVELLLQLESNLTIGALEQFLEFVRRSYKLSCIVYICPSFRGRSLIEPFILEAQAPGSAEDFATARRQLLDPMLQLVARSVLPMDWGRIRRGRLAKKGQLVFADSAGRERQGVSIPVRGPSNSLWALFMAASTESEGAWSARRYELTKILVHVAHYVHQRAGKIHAEEEPFDLNAITKREIEALEWVAHGKKLAEIAPLMGISVETVKAHLDSARYKLQALNRLHAVAKALRAGLIS